MVLPLVLPAAVCVNAASAAVEFVVFSVAASEESAAVSVPAVVCVPAVVPAEPADRCLHFLDSRCYFPLFYSVLADRSFSFPHSLCRTPELTHDRPTFLIASALYSCYCYA